MQGIEALHFQADSVCDRLAKRESSYENAVQLAQHGAGIPDERLRDGTHRCDPSLEDHLHSSAPADLQRLGLPSDTRHASLHAGAVRECSDASSVHRRTGEGQNRCALVCPCGARCHLPPGGIRRPRRCSVHLDQTSAPPRPPNVARPDLLRRDGLASRERRTARRVGTPGPRHRGSRPLTLLRHWR